jgi:phosphate-selective porin OprO and OprP
MPIRTAALVAIFSLLLAATIQAQTASAPPAGVAPAFVIQSDNGDNLLQFGFVFQVDGRFSLDDPTPIIDTFTIRRMRPTFSGRVARYFDFKLMPDFGSGAAVLVDAYIDVRFSPKFRVRTGKDKSPVGYEYMIGDAFLTFPERSLATSLVPGRDIGVQAQGDLGPHVYYAAGLFNGVPDGTSSTSDLDTNNAKDFAARLLVQQFRKSAGNTGALSGVGFQIGGSSGTQSGALPAFRTSVGQTYFSYATGVTARGTRTRITPAIFYSYKGLGLFGEYVRSTQETARASAARELTNSAWNITGSYLLTGEAASTGIIRPRRPFDPPTGTWGALQLVARYSELRVDSDAFSSAFAAAASSRAAQQITVGVNWYPAAVLKYYATYERTHFDQGVAPARPVEHIVLFRVQLGI